jgi:hypothetical protein
MFIFLTFKFSFDADILPFWATLMFWLLFQKNWATLMFWLLFQKKNWATLMFWLLFKKIGQLFPKKSGWAVPGARFLNLLRPHLMPCRSKLECLLISIKFLFFLFLGRHFLHLGPVLLNILRQ